MRAAFDGFFGRTRGAYAQQRSFERARHLALALLVCMGRRTVTGMLCAAGQQFRDCSAYYRLFERERIDCGAMFDGVLAGALSLLPAGAPLVGALDDTLVRKRGRCVAGASWRRDPLGPPFANGLAWSNRFLQVSLALPERPDGPSPARMIPVDLLHCPSPHKPGSKATEQQCKQWREASAKAAITAKGAARVAALRTALDAHGMSQRPLVMSADGTFTCRAVFKSLPARVVLIGRIRKDARLYMPPTPGEENRGRGRKRAYGQRLPTPEQIRQDDTVPWQQVRAHAAGKTHTFDLKEITPCLWKCAGAQRRLRLVVIRPLAYRLRATDRLNYRKPAYLITTDLAMPLADLLQAYIWRWEIEVNFRDEKTLIGMGQAQVRTRQSIETLTPFVAATYAMLLLAQEQCGGNKHTLPLPCWQKPSPDKAQRTSTGQAIRQLRYEIWHDAITSPKSDGFAAKHARYTSPQKIETSMQSAVFYASG